MTAQQSWESSYYALEDSMDRVYLLRRTDARFPSAATLDAETDWITAVFDRTGRTGRGLLVDVRLAPAGADEAMAESFLRHRDRINEGFERVAILVRTAVGRLHAGRLARNAGHCVQIYDDESQALSHAAAEAPKEA